MRKRPRSRIADRKSGAIEIARSSSRSASSRTPGAGRDRREQAHGIDVARMLAQHTPVQLLGLAEAAFLLVLGRERHHPPLGRQREAALEGLIGFGAPPQDRQRLAEREPRVLELRIEMRRSL